MAEALIKLVDKDGDFEMQVKFYPRIDDDSPSHRIVQQFVEFAHLQRETSATDGNEHTAT